MSTVPGKELLEKHTWAVIGDVLNTSKPSGQIVQRLHNHKKTVYLVNPRGPKEGSSQEDTVYASITDIPDANRIEVLDVVINPKAGVKAVQEAYTAGIKNFFLQPGADTAEVIDAVKRVGGRYHQGCVLIEMLPPEGPSGSSKL